MAQVRSSRAANRARCVVCIFGLWDRVARSWGGTRTGRYRADERGSETEEASVGPEKGSSIRAARTAIKGSFSPALVGGHYYYCVRSGRYTTVAHTEIRGTIWAVCVSAIKRLGSGGREGVGSVRNTKYTQRGTRRTKRAWYSILMGEETLTAAFPLSLLHPSLPCLFSTADARRAGTSVG